MDNFITRLKFLFTGECGNACEWSKKYGCFVPEADCPVHDYSPFINQPK